MPRTLVRGFRLEMLDESGNWSVAARVQNNDFRLVRVPIARQIRGLRFVPEATWGAKTARVFSLEPLEIWRGAIPDAPDGPHFSEVVAALNNANLVVSEKGWKLREANSESRSA